MHRFVQRRRDFNFSIECVKIMMSISSEWHNIISSISPYRRSRIHWSVHFNLLISVRWVHLTEEFQQILHNGHRHLLTAQWEQRMKQRCMCMTGCIHLLAHTPRNKLPQFCAQKWRLLLSWKLWIYKFKRVAVTVAYFLLLFATALANGTPWEIHILLIKDAQTSLAR